VSPGTEGRYESVFEKILELNPKSEAQRALHAQALKVVNDTGQLRWLLYSQPERSIPIPLLAVMVFWLAISFASFGLFAPRNATAMVALIACALAVATALFLILELDRPFQGMIQISSAPLHKAWEQLGR
jgi:O-antigen ligase